MNSIANFTQPLGSARIDPPPLRLAFGGLRVALGFPSPAEDFQEGSIDLNELLVRNAPATFFYRARGHSMQDAGIYDGDILIIDRSVEPKHGDIVVAIWDGNAPVCKKLEVHQEGVQLHSCNPQYPVIRLRPEVELEAFVVVGVVRQMRRTKAAG